ncbi:adipokinetic hormone/corazonin-related peptide receptor variant I-like isoform X1 [Cloeon dipterum]|uniref:adipokinetic hormone/corazonin-related peptide receptor variant I-like isoform X1 n=1 Tax=Cloeon dipterum TaxID=197152 RepID=UPI0032208BBB
MDAAEENFVAKISDEQLAGNLSVWRNGSEVYDGDAEPTLPPELRFNTGALVAIIVYSSLFVVAAVGNVTVFVTLYRNRHRKSRINLMIMHLAIADMVVTFVMIPLEVGWRATTQWLAGNAACKILLFLRAFGLYLSSMVLVCVSLDRYFAILYPLRVNDARRRGKMMLILAWVVSIICSMPQSIVFHVSQHPVYKDFWQCVTFGAFPSQKEETAYNLFCVLVMYFIPLIVICFAYSRILWEIFKKSRENKEDNIRGGRYQGRMPLRRSDMSNIERARSRTLRMTLIIVLVFIWCWTPYVVMTLWYMFDRESATHVEGWIQDSLFMMAVSNSCMNPFVYGAYAMNFQQEFWRCVSCVCCRRSKKDRNIVGVSKVIEQTKPRPDTIIIQVHKCLLSIFKANSNTAATRSTGVPPGLLRPGPSPRYRPVMPGTSAMCKGSKMLSIPEANPEFLSFQLSGNSKASVDSIAEYSYNSVAFYSEPLQVHDRDEEERWRHRQRGGTAASTRVKASPSIDRLEGLRRWQGTSEVHLEPPP